MAPRSQKRPELANITPNQNHSQNSSFGSIRRSDSHQIGNQPLYFHKMTLRKGIRAQEGVLHHNVAPRLQIRPELAKNTPSQYHPQNSTFCSVRGFDRCYIGYQQLYFHRMTLSKVVRALEGAPKPQSGSLITKTAWIGQKLA